MPGERPVEEREAGFLALPGAATEQETATMFFDSDFDPVTPTAGELPAEIGLDTRAVRDTLADDWARRCPDRETPADRR